MADNVPDDAYRRTVEVLRDAGGPLSTTELGAKLDLSLDKVPARSSPETLKTI